MCLVHETPVIKIPILYVDDVDENPYNLVTKSNKTKVYWENKKKLVLDNNFVQ